MNRCSICVSLLLVAVTAVAILADRFDLNSRRSHAEARLSADRLEEDLLSCYPFTGTQTFTMDEGATNKLSFIATTLVGTTHQTARITYYVNAQGGVERRQ